MKGGEGARKEEEGEERLSSKMTRIGQRDILEYKDQRQGERRRE